MTLNPSKTAPLVYDGRYDQYIMTDSDDDFMVDESMNVGLLAEAAAILVIGCVAGLKGIGKIRKKVRCRRSDITKQTACSVPAQAHQIF